MEAIEKAQELTGEALRRVVDLGLDGSRVLSSAKELAHEYGRDERYRNTDARVDSLINWEKTKSFATGFATSVGGLIALPVQLPASLLAAWVVQARLAGAIAELYGHDCREDRVRTLVLCCLLGDSAREALKRAGVVVGNKLSETLLSRIPGAVFIEINKLVGFRLITKAGEKGVVNVIKLVPLVGGAVGGSIDLLATQLVGKTAKDLFGCCNPQVSPAEGV